MTRDMGGDLGVREYFVDAHGLLQRFEKCVADEVFPRRLILIHGPSGVGKTTLLLKYRDLCRHNEIPVAFANAAECQSAVDVVRRWVADLKKWRLQMLHSQKLLRRLQQVLRPAGFPSFRYIEVPQPELGAFPLSPQWVAQFIISFVAEPIGRYMDRKRREREQEIVSDAQLLQDPAPWLADTLIKDLNSLARRRRVVLMLDTYEQMATADAWMRNLAQSQPENAALVVAGHHVPHWDRDWPDWRTHVELVHLKPMDEEKLKELIRRYAACQTRSTYGGEATELPDDAVDAIVQFADGLPVLAVVAVDFWLSHEAMELGTVGHMAKAELGQRILASVSEDMKPVFRAAAVLRRFNADALRYLGVEGADEHYQRIHRYVGWVKPLHAGRALHDKIRESICAALLDSEPESFRALNQSAVDYYEEAIQRARDPERSALELERLYHLFMADPTAGLELFQEAAEELTRYRMVHQLRALLDDVSTYTADLPEGVRRWVEYYLGRLAYLEGRLTDAEAVYRRLCEDEQTEPRLRSYAYCDWGEILTYPRRLSEPFGPERAIKVLEQGRQLGILDQKTVLSLGALAGVYSSRGEWEKAVECEQERLKFFEGQRDRIGIALSEVALYGRYALWGKWREAFDARSRALDQIASFDGCDRVCLPLRASVFRVASWALVWAGRPSEAEKQLRDGLELARRFGDQARVVGCSKGMVLALAAQGEYGEAERVFRELVEIIQLVSEVRNGTSEMGFYGAALLRQGHLDEADSLLLQSLTLKEKSGDFLGIPELLIWLGELHELRRDWQNAEQYYLDQCLGEYRWVGRLYFQNAALAGMVRVRYAQGSYEEIPPLVREAEELAWENEYNDHLAALRLTQGHLAWDGRVSQWAAGFDAALSFYKQALVYALRYNRFLLDEVLSGRPEGTPLSPIIPQCRERGEEGRKMLTALAEWWQNGTNDVGAPRPDTISPIPEGVLLREAERLARQREPGDGSRQTDLLTQIQEAVSRNR